MAGVAEFLRFSASELGIPSPSARAQPLGECDGVVAQVGNQERCQRDMTAPLMQVGFQVIDGFDKTARTRTALRMDTWVGDGMAAGPMPHALSTPEA